MKFKRAFILFVHLFNPRQLNGLRVTFFVVLEVVLTCGKVASFSL